MPYDLNLIKFYDSIKHVSDTEFTRNDTIPFSLLNIPKEILTIGIANVKIRLGNNGYEIIPLIGSSDTLKIFFSYITAGHGYYHGNIQKYLIK